MVDVTPEATTAPKRIRLDKVRKRIRAAEAAHECAKAGLPERVRLFERDERAKLAQERAEIEAMHADLEELERGQKEARAERRIEARLDDLETIIRPEVGAELRAELLARELGGMPAKAGAQAQRKRGRPKGSRNRTEPRVGRFDMAAEPSLEVENISAAFDEMCAEGDRAAQRSRLDGAPGYRAANVLAPVAQITRSPEPASPAELETVPPPKRREEAGASADAALPAAAALGKGKEGNIRREPPVPEPTSQDLAGSPGRGSETVRGRAASAATGAAMAIGSTSFSPEPTPVESTAAGIPAREPRTPSLPALIMAQRSWVPEVDPYDYEWLTLPVDEDGVRHRPDGYKIDEEGFILNPQGHHVWRIPPDEADPWDVDVHLRWLPPELRPRPIDLLSPVERAACKAAARSDPNYLRLKDKFKELGTCFLGIEDGRYGGPLGQHWEELEQEARRLYDLSENYFYCLYIGLELPQLPEREDHYDPEVVLARVCPRPIL